MYVSPFLCSEEGNQATAKLAFGFTRAYNEKIRKHGVRLMRSGRIFEYGQEKVRQRRGSYAKNNQYITDVPTEAEALF